MSKGSHREGRSDIIAKSSGIAWHMVYICSSKEQDGGEHRQIASVITGRKLKLLRTVYQPPWHADRERVWGT